MWCDNCLLFFPLRAGAIILATFMGLYQIAGGIFLFLWGGEHNKIEAGIYGGYAMAQGALAFILVIAFSNRSYLFTKFLFRIYPVIVLLGAIRAGVMAWQLQHWEYRIVGECLNGGRKWVSDIPSNSTSIDPSTATPTYDYTSNSTLPSSFCTVGVHNLIQLFTSSLPFVPHMAICYQTSALPTTKLHV
ncbi:4049_t:CDS:2 [Ambispora gerdemannii]|uniref:4049_t:CDS:1 n=1 Tax=Ambispora gerdemannii TaxID=144530 RepID=A0A9N9CC76_9GLOM|nr:4049_t:CDS:2 [Ambispora gerdemannii]